MHAINSFKSFLSQNYYSALGWKTNRKIIVFESDDWGAIRMPSNDVREYLKSKSIKFSNYGYDDYDTLASKEDLECLFNVLQKYKDINGRCPVITANTIVANPDFERIYKSNFEEYFYELFTDTLNRYYPNEDVVSVWKEGINSRLFYPQFHGREHLNVQMWLALLKKGDKNVREAFSKNNYSLILDDSVTKKLLHAYNITSETQKDFVKESISDGLRIFHNIFGFKSETTIAPSFTWDGFLEEAFYENGIRCLQGSFVQSCSLLYKRKKIRHYIGEKNKLAQIYLTRNASFEPSQNKQHREEVVEACLRDIERAFFWKKPAIISAHRLNFIGGLDKENRRRNLVLLDRLLLNILNKYGDIEFLSSAELYRVIKSSRQK